MVILTGADPAFCAGVDLKELSGETPRPTDIEPMPPRDTNGLYRFFPLIDKPIIGAINGVAVTGGFEVALQCTFLVASQAARFADTHSRIGVMPGGGITVLLAQTIGVRRAIELSITGNFLSADEAFRIGLVNHVVPHDELLPFARQLAADVVSNDPVGVRRLLQNYRAIANAATLDEAHLVEGYMAETWQRSTEDVASRRERGDVARPAAAARSTGAEITRQGQATSGASVLRRRAGDRCSSAAPRPARGRLGRRST